MRTFRGIGSGLLLLAALAPGQSWAGEPPSRSSLSVQEVLTARAFRIIRAAPSVEVRRIDAMDQVIRGVRRVNDPKKPQPAERVAGYAVLGHPRPFPVALVPRLRALILSRKSYEVLGRGNSACPFMPGVALRFSPRRPGGQSAEILLCFECAQLAIVKLPSETARDSDWGHVDLQEITRSELSFLDLITKALPDDQELLELLRRKREQAVAE